jgi:hypothetical protein
MKTLTKILPLLALSALGLFGCAPDVVCQSDFKSARECYEERLRDEDDEPRKEEEPKTITPDYVRR